MVISINDIQRENILGSEKNMSKIDIKELISQISTKKETKGNKFVQTIKNINRKKNSKSIMMGIGGFGLFVLIAILIWFYGTIIPSVPKLSVDELDKLFSQTTTIEDKNGKELYKLFSEHRTNIKYDEISESMINAIVAVEDQSFWTNNGIDFMGIVRAGIVTVRSKLFGGSVQGASTITQQSVKNLLLTNDRNMTRKVKEIVLALQLDNLLDYEINKNNPQLSSKEVQRKKKERIMELYLNYIFMGNNAYGIESASQIYFNKPAKELNIIESAILASIPKSPTRYSPYRDNGKLLGDIEIFNRGERVSLSGESMLFINELIAEKVQKASFSKGNFTTEIEKVVNLTAAHENKNYTVSYKRGRKDHVLNRMYELGFISEQELKNAFIEGLGLVFNKTSITDMKAPHFIFYIQDYLTTNPEFAELGINQESLLEGGFTIVTTLDETIQEYAEKAVTKYMTQAQQKGGSNRAMVYLDSKNGDILAYVGSADYNNKEIEGENDMVSVAKRQPGSSVKPFIYSRLFQTQPSSIDTPVADIPITLAGLRPNNADGGFRGMMPIKEALAGSRNIPAVKTYLAAGQEEELKPFMQQLGMKSLETNHAYGYSLALGAGEITMLELATAYTHLSALGRPAEINPIQEIRDPTGKVIYQKKVKTLATPIILPEVASMIWSILSDPANMPAGWERTLSVGGLQIGIKSGTSNKVKATGEKVPGDGWLATYTPSKVAIFWVGNADGSPLNSSAFGGNLNSPVMKDFYSQLLNNKLIQTESMPKVPGVSSISISKISGKLAGGDTPESLIVQTLAYKIPGTSDDGARNIEFDALCGGKVSEYTPSEDIKHGYVITPATFIPSKYDIGDIVVWLKQGNALSKYGDSHTATGNITYNMTNFFVQDPEEICEERIPKIDEAINVAITKPLNNTTIAENFSINYTIESPRNIKLVKVLIDNDPVKEIQHNGTSITHVEKVSLLKDKYQGSHMLTILAIDQDGFSNQDSLNVTIGDDTTPPYLDTSSVSVTKLANGQYKVSLKFVDDSSAIKGGTIKFAENPTREERFSKANATVTVNSLQSIGFVVKDIYENKGVEIVNLSQYYNGAVEDVTTTDNQENIDGILDALGGL